MPIPTILHIEDDPNDGLLVRIAFQRAKLPVHLVTVEEGEKAIDYLNGSEAYSDREQYPFPDLVLLDLRLPRKSGMEVLGWIRSRPDLKKLPVVTLTSSEQMADRQQARELGITDYFSKPVSVAPLERTVTEIYHRWLT